MLQAALSKHQDPDEIEFAIFEHDYVHVASHMSDSRVHCKRTGPFSVHFVTPARLRFLRSLRPHRYASSIAFEA